MPTDFIIMPCVLNFFLKVSNRSVGPASVLEQPCILQSTEETGSAYNLSFLLPELPRVKLPYLSLEVPFGIIKNG